MPSDEEPVSFYTPEEVPSATALVLGVLAAIVSTALIMLGMAIVLALAVVIACGMVGGLGVFGLALLVRAGWRWVKNTWG